eukprot:3165274-Pyramimonas_sp.AAC.1
MRGDDCHGVLEKLGREGGKVLRGSALVWEPAVGSEVVSSRRERSECLGHLEIFGQANAPGCALIRPRAG